MPFQKAINRRLDFGINANNEAIPSKSSGTTLGFGENPPSSGMIKRTIEHVSPSDSNANEPTWIRLFLLDLRSKRHQEGVRSQDEVLDLF